VRELANSLIFEVHDGVANLAGATPVRKLIVERALKYLDRLAKDAKEDRSLELELATAYDKIGDVQGEPMEANLGDPSAAVLSYQKALTLRESIAAEDPQDTRTARELIYSYIRLSDLLGYQGDFNRALDFARKEIPTAQKLVQHDTSDPKNEFLLASCYADQGFKEAKAGDRAAGLMTLRMGAEMFEHLLSKIPADLATRRSLALTYGRIGDIERFDSSGDSDSLTTFQKAAATLHPALIQDPNNTEIRRIVAYDQRSIGELLDSMNQKPAALSQEREALASLRKLAVSDPANAQLQKDIACVRGRIGIILTELGEPSNAITELVRADTALEGAQDAKVPQSYYGYRLLLIQLWLGKAQVDLATSLKSPWAQREEHCRQAQEWFQRCLPGFDSLREKGSDYGADQALNDIRLGTLRCQARGH
jgi:non-specific serine/threonine protein kinase/serine/threonine-protein kinase